MLVPYCFIAIISPYPTIQDLLFSSLHSETKGDLSLPSLNSCIVFLRIRKLRDLVIFPKSTAAYDRAELLIYDCQHPE